MAEIPPPAGNQVVKAIGERRLVSESQKICEDM